MNLQFADNLNVSTRNAGRARNLTNKSQRSPAITAIRPEIFIGKTSIVRIPGRLGRIITRTRGLERPRNRLADLKLMCSPRAPVRACDIGLRALHTFTIHFYFEYYAERAGQQPLYAMLDAMASPAAYVIINVPRSRQISYSR